MEHKFEYDGADVVMRSPTVADRITRRLIVRKLRKAYDVPPDRDMTDVLGEDITESIVEYADILSKTTSPESAWWKASGDSPESLRAGFECYMVSEADLFDLLATAESNTTLEKKQRGNGSKKSQK